MTATDLADAMVRRGVPFREAHEAVGRAVRLAIKKGSSLDGLDRAGLAEADPRLQVSDLKSVEPKSAVAARKSEGGTARKSVLLQIAAEKRRLGG